MAVVVAASKGVWQQRGDLFIVADGMGAHAAGERASKLSIDTVPLVYQKLADRTPGEAMLAALEEANAQIHSRGQASIDFKGMGTTTTVLALLPFGALVAHVGDSRAYRLRGTRLEQLTFRSQPGMGDARGRPARLRTQERDNTLARPRPGGEGRSRRAASDRAGRHLSAMQRRALRPGQGRRDGHDPGQHAAGRGGAVAGRPGEHARRAGQHHSDCRQGGRFRLVAVLRRRAAAPRGAAAGAVHGLDRPGRVGAGGAAVAFDATVDSGRAFASSRRQCWARAHGSIAKGAKSRGRR